MKFLIFITQEAWSEFFSSVLNVTKFLKLKFNFFPWPKNFGKFPILYWVSNDQKNVHSNHELLFYTFKSSNFRKNYQFFPKISHFDTFADAYQWKGFIDKHQLPNSFFAKPDVTLVWSNTDKTQKILQFSWKKIIKIFFVEKISRKKNDFFLWERHVFVSLAVTYSTRQETFDSWRLYRTLF